MLLNHATLGGDKCSEHLRKFFDNDVYCVMFLSKVSAVFTSV